MLNTILLMLLVDMFLTDLKLIFLFQVYHLALNMPI